MLLGPKTVKLPFTAPNRKYTANRKPTTRSAQRERPLSVLVVARPAPRILPIFSKTLRKLNT